METQPFHPGDVLLLEHKIPGISYATGLFVLVSLTYLQAEVSLVSSDASGLYAIDNPYQILREDLAAFTDTGQHARLAK